MSISTGRYIARFCYEDGFKPEMEKFLRLIYLDKELHKLNKHQKFSAAMRFLIKKYNDQRGPIVMEEINKARNESTENTETK